MVELADAVKAYSALAIQLGALTDLLAALESDEAGEGRPLCATVGCTPASLRDRAHYRLKGLVEGPDCVAQGVDTVCRGWRLLSAELELVKRESESWAGPLAAPGLMAATRAANVLGAAGLFNLARRAARRASRVTVNCTNATHHVEAALYSALEELRPKQAETPAPSGASRSDEQPTCPRAGPPLSGTAATAGANGSATEPAAAAGSGAPAECGRALAVGLLRDFDRACDPLVGILDLARRVMLELEDVETVVDQSLIAPASTTAYAASVHAPSRNATAGPSAPSPRPATYRSTPAPSVSWRSPRARLPLNALATWFTDQSPRVDRLPPAVLALGDQHDSCVSIMGSLFHEQWYSNRPPVELAAPEWDPHPNHTFPRCPWTRRQRLRCVLADAFGCPHAAAHEAMSAVRALDKALGGRHSAGLAQPHEAGRANAPTRLGDGIPLRRPRQPPRRSLSERHLDFSDVVTPLCELDITTFCDSEKWTATGCALCGVEQWFRVKDDALRSVAAGSGKWGTGTEADKPSPNTAFRRYVDSVLRRSDGRRVDRWATGPGAWRRRPRQRVREAGRAELARWGPVATPVDAGRPVEGSGDDRTTGDRTPAGAKPAASSIADLLDSVDDDEEVWAEDVLAAAGRGAAAPPDDDAHTRSRMPPPTGDMRTVVTVRARGGLPGLRSPPRSRARRNGGSTAPTAPQRRPAMRRVGTHSPSSLPGRRAPRRPVAREGGLELLHGGSSSEKEAASPRSGRGSGANQSHVPAGEAVDGAVLDRARVVHALLSACGRREKDSLARATIFNGIVDFVVRAVRRRALQFRVRTRRVLGKVGGGTPLPLVRPASCMFALCRVAIPTAQHRAYGPAAPKNPYAAAGISVGRDVVDDRYGALQRGVGAAPGGEECEEEVEDRDGGEGDAGTGHAPVAPKRASLARGEHRVPDEVLPGKRMRRAAAVSREQTAARSPVGGAWPGDRLRLARVAKKGVASRTGREGGWPRAWNQDHAGDSVTPQACQHVRTPPQAIPTLTGPLLRSMRLLPIQEPRASPLVAAPRLASARTRKRACSPFHSLPDRRRAAGGAASELRGPVDDGDPHRHLRADPVRRRCPRGRAQAQSPPHLTAAGCAACPREPVSREPQAGPSSCGGVTSSLRSSRRSRWTTMSMRWCFHDGGGSLRPAPPASSYSRRSCRPPLDATSHSLHPLPGVSQRAACASYRWRRGRRCDATEAEPIEGTKPASCEACTQAIASCSAAAATRASCCEVSNAFTSRSSKRGSAAVEARRMIPARRPCMSWHADT